MGIFFMIPAVPLEKRSGKNCLQLNESQSLDSQPKPELQAAVTKHQLTKTNPTKNQNQPIKINNPKQKKTKINKANTNKPHETSQTNQKRPKKPSKSHI